MSITRNLSNLYVSESFQRLAQIDPNDNKSLLFGTGSYVTDLKITGSLEISSRFKTNLPNSSQISLYIDPVTSRPRIENETTPATASIVVLEQGASNPTAVPSFGGTSAIGTLYVNTISGDFFVYTIIESGSRPSGSSRPAPTSGTSGTSGPAGLSGSSGTSGLTYATSGVSGTSGTSGPAGSSGTSGAAGAAGSSGTSGAAGAAGSSGTSGAAGAVGSSGTSGAAGAVGSSGTSGITGSSGTSGITGSSGTSGITGSSGTSGISGSSGTSTGTSGTSGPAGSSGTSGTSGTSGSSGTSGTSGSSGTSGTSGSAGTSGTSGSAGTSGTSGSAGTSGTSGSAGTSGTSGSAGTSGGAGTSGTSGSAGTSGGAGTSGTSGSAGTSGTAGGGTSGAPSASLFITPYLIGDGSSSLYTLTHNSNYRDVAVSVFDSSNQYDAVYPTIYYNSVNSIDLNFSPSTLSINEMSASILNYSTTSYSEVIGNGASTQFIVTHSFGTREALVFVRQSGSLFEEVTPDVFYDTVNTVRFNFATIPSSSEYIANIIPYTSSLGNVYSQNIGNGSETVFTITHNLNTKHVFVTIRETVSPFEKVFADIYHDNNNQIILSFATPPPVSQYKVNIIG